MNKNRVASLIIYLGASEEVMTSDVSALAYSTDSNMAYRPMHT